MALFKLLNRVHVLEHFQLAEHAPVPLVVLVFFGVHIHEVEVHVCVLGFDFHQSLDVHFAQVLVHVYELDHGFETDIFSLAVQFA